MKYLLVLSACLVVMSCDKELEVRQPPACFEMGANPNYVTIPFKKDYTIQLPFGYTGDGITMWEQVDFWITTGEGSHLFYFYGCATDCISYFGEKLPSPAPDTISGFYWQDGEPLGRAHEYCLAGDVQAILYLGLHPGAESHGKLFMKQGDDFKEGLKIRFDYNNMAEIESILETIAKQ